MLALARGLVLALPFRTIAARLGAAQATGAGDPASAQGAQAQQIGWAVRSLARHTPWDSNCLAQAIAATLMLRRRQIPSALYLGVRKNATNPTQIDAHAWVTCGDHVLTGAPGHERFTVIAIYGDLDSHHPIH